MFLSHVNLLGNFHLQHLIGELETQNTGRRRLIFNVVDFSRLYDLACVLHHSLLRW